MRGLPDTDETIGDAMRAEGYRTVHVGKWHLGTSERETLPGAKGFDRFEVFNGDPIAETLQIITQDGEIERESLWRARTEANTLIRELDDAIASGEPVYLSWWPIEPHEFQQANGEEFYIPPTFDRTAFDLDNDGPAPDFNSNRGKLLSMLYSWDAEFGRIVDHLRNNGLLEDSLIVVTSDNGGKRNALSPVRDFSGEKTTLAEGGIRVPFFASWPRRIAPNTHSDITFQSTDLYPTIVGLIGGSPVRGIEGKDLSPALLRGAGSRNPMYFELRRDVFRLRRDETVSDTFALIDGCEKIVSDQGVLRLYNVCEDPGETRDLSTSEPDRFTQLSEDLKQRRRAESTFAAYETVNGTRNLADNRRLDVHHDDFGFYATVDSNALRAGQVYRLYERGDGIGIYATQNSISARFYGVADGSKRPALKQIEFSAPLPMDGNHHEVAVIARGYLRGGTSFSIYVDGQLAGSLLPPLNARMEAGQSIMAIAKERSTAQLGDDRLTLLDVMLLTNALEPDEI
jgi:arylsulfatase A-like enzyme